MILSSHLLADVEDVCDRAVILYGGKIQQYGTLEELLTEHDSIRFTMPALSEEAQREVMGVIKKHVKSEDVRVENPTQNLESFFLNVVENAITKDVETSGTTSGHEVAEFLRSDAPVQTQAEKMLERLADKEASKPKPKIEKKEPEEEQPKVDEEKLKSLSESNETAQPKAKAPKNKATERQQDIDEADDKLSGLLGGD